MKVKIHDLNNHTNYIAENESDCKDATDKSVFQEVVRANDVITMGKVIGEPLAEIDLPSYLVDVDLYFEDPQFNCTVNNNGDNCTDEEIRKYYVGTKFDQSPTLDVEDFHTCINVVIHRDN
jgi:hypothetical protein